MGLASNIVRFVARELTRPLLEKAGEHIGDAIGTIIGKRIDPAHGNPKEETRKGESNGNPNDIPPAHRE